TGDRLGEQGLPGPRRPDQEHTLRDLAAESPVPLRILQKIAHPHPLDPGSVRKTTVSLNSARASSIPAMSSKLTPVWCSTYTFARLLPMDIIPLWGFIRFMTTIQSPTKITAGRIHDSSVAIHVFVTCPVNPTWAASSSGTSPGSSTRVVTKSGALPTE